MALADSGERNSDLGDSLYRVIAKSSINPHRKLQIVLTWTTDDITIKWHPKCQTATSMTNRYKPLSGAEMLRTAFGKMSQWFWTSMDWFVTALCQIWTDFRLVSELAESQRNRPVRNTRSVSGTVLQRVLDAFWKESISTNLLVLFIAWEYGGEIFNSLVRISRFTQCYSVDQNVHWQDFTNSLFVQYAW